MFARNFQPALSSICVTKFHEKLFTCSSALGVHEWDMRGGKFDVINWIRALGDYHDDGLLTKKVCLDGAVVCKKILALIRRWLINDSCEALKLESCAIWHLTNWFALLLLLLPSKLQRRKLFGRFTFINSIENITASVCKFPEPKKPKRTPREQRTKLYLQTSLSSRATNKFTSFSPPLEWEREVDRRNAGYMRLNLSYSVARGKRLSMGMQLKRLNCNHFIVCRGYCCMIVPIKRVDTVCTKLSCAVARLLSSGAGF